jgi:iron(III) transport system ATP-binding protein
MSRVVIEGVTKKFEGKPPTTAIDDLNIVIEEGEFLVLLGPSGCGKTTTLRCLAGLETADSGRIDLGARTVFDSDRKVNLSPDKRNLGMVFQSYALWPNMTVRKNIAYPLKARRLRHGIADGWVESTADIVDCGSLLDRYPGQLSGGQQQRVALARGLVARPDLLLFDEPLSNLDARLRELVRAELAELHERLSFTAVYVTHDQSEALALGDRLAIMRQGKVEQLGAPQDVFQAPVSEYVAAFIGMENRLELDATGHGWAMGSTMLAGMERQSPAGSTVTVRLRPDDLRVHRTADQVRRGDVALPATVAVSAFGGRHYDVVLAVGDRRLQARVPTNGQDPSFAHDDQVIASFDPACAALFNAAGDPIRSPDQVFCSKPSARAAVG